MWEVPTEIYVCHLKHGVYCADAHETRVPQNTFTDIFRTDYLLYREKKMYKNSKNIYLHP
jgi:hypothetical protein